MNDLQDKLALAQLENMKLREALEKIVDGRDTHKVEKCKHGQYGYEHCEFCLTDIAEQALSNPTTHAELDAYVDAKFGEPVAIASQHYEYSGKGYGSVATDQLDITLTAYGAKTVRIGSKLYTAPPQPQTVKDALEEAARICDEMIDWELEKHPAATLKSDDYLIGIRRGLINATNAIRALIEKD